MTHKYLFNFAPALFVLSFILLSAAVSPASAQGWTAGAARGSTPTTTPALSKSSARGKTSVGRRSSVRTARSRPNAERSRKSLNSSAATESSASLIPKSSRERRVSDTRVAANRPRQTTTTKGIKSSESVAASKSGRCNPDKDERVDLSGSYAGRINYPAGGMLGDATLIVSGNKFTLNSGSKSETGNITAIATCKYTAVAMMFGQWKTPLPGEPVLPPLPMLSLTATKKGDRLILKVSPSERHEFSFEPGARN